MKKLYEIFNKKQPKIINFYKKSMYILLIYTCSRYFIFFKFNYLRICSTTLATIDIPLSIISGVELV